MPHIKAGILENINQHLQTMEPNSIRAFDEEVSCVPGIIKLTLGEPDFNVPRHIKDAAIASINADDSHYAPASGSKELRTAVSSFLSDRYQLQYNPEDEVVVTVGATEAIYDALTTILNPGDKILVPTPIFPLYFPDSTLNGAEVIYLDTSSSGFVLQPEQLQAAIDQYGDDIKGLILNFPCNPTGVTYSKQQLKDLANVIQTTDIVVISDEIYSELTYEEKHHSMAEFLPDQTLLLNGVSKSHAMTGYRIGFVAGPAALVEKVNILHQFTTTAASNPAMAAATEALSTTAGKQDTLSMRVAYQKRRDYLYNELKKLGFEMPEPAGAFYIFAKIPTNQEQDDFAFCLDLAKNAKVALIPGSAFGPGGEGYVRISYATSEEQLHNAVDNIASYLKK